MKNLFVYHVLALIHGGSRISQKAIHMYKGMGVHLADFINFFKYPMKMRPNYFMFKGYLKMGAGRGFTRTP